MTRPPASPANLATGLPAALLYPAASAPTAPPVPSPAAAALAEVSAAFADVLEDLQFSFVIASARAEDMPIVFASPGFFTSTGYSPAEVLGRNCRFLQGPATSHQAVMEIRDAIREERSCSVCLLNYRKDRSPFWNYLRLQPVRQPGGGAVDYVVGLQADVTRLVEAGGGLPLEGAAAAGQEAAALVAARVEAHEAELAAADCTRKCAVLGCVPSSLLGALVRLQECFVLSDPSQPDCPIVYASPAFLSMCGYPCSEVVGRNCRFLQGPGTCPQAVDQMRSALSADPPRPVTVTLLNYKKNGQPFWNSLHISPLRDAGGKVQYFVGVQMEITAEAVEGNAELAAAESAMATAGVATGAAEPPAADPLALLRQKGVVGSLRVATRALAQHGLRREKQFQHAPCRLR